MLVLCVDLLFGLGIGIGLGFLVGVWVWVVCSCVLWCLRVVALVVCALFRGVCLCVRLCVLCVVGFCCVLLCLVLGLCWFVVCWLRVCACVWCLCCVYWFVGVLGLLCCVHV